GHEKPVVISVKKIITGSKNLNGTGHASQVIDEQNIHIAGKISLGELLNRQVNGFRTGFSGDGQREYKLYSTPVHFVFDGVDIAEFNKSRKRPNIKSY